MPLSYDQIEAGEVGEPVVVAGAHAGVDGSPGIVKDLADVRGGQRVGVERAAGGMDTWQQGLCALSNSVSQCF